MLKQLFLLALLSMALNSQADFPVKGLDPLNLQANFAGVEILNELSFASANCRENYFPCGDWSEFVNLDQTGITNDGRTATLSISRWFYEPMSIRVGQHVWSEVVYFQIWTGAAPYTDYTGASMVVQGVNFWNFVDEVLDYVDANRKGSFTLSAPGWYGTHLSDFAVTAQTAAPANIIITATVNKVPQANMGEIEINFGIKTQ